MSKLAITAVVIELCKTSKPCAHHLEQAARIVDVVVLAQKVERDKEAQAALDRIVERVTKEGTYAT